MESIRLVPRGKVDVTLRVPGSKSITNRALVTAALAEGRSTLTNASLSDDSRYLTGALRKVGVPVEVEGTTCTVEGCGGEIAPGGGTLFMGNAGTALRFFTSVACLGKGRYVVDGDRRMRSRPIEPLVAALAQLGPDISCVNGCPPVTVKADGLRGGTAKIDASLSSQYVSSILMAAPCSREGVVLQLTGPLTSEPYVAMTEEVMKRFGVQVRRAGEDQFDVAAGRYAGREYEVEGDAASAGYFFAMAAVTGGRARVEGIGRGCAQAEFGLVALLERMGCEVDAADDYVEVRGGKLAAIDADMNRCPDSVLALCAAALFAGGTTHVRNVANLRVKETDRIAALAAELAKFGAKVEEREDGLSITPPAEAAAAEVATYDDHRMAMAFSVAGAVVPVTIQNPGCVSKSFPGFFERLKGMGLVAQA
ncbi:MAG: 3-phosphoshikimate 1-carboxyvinyltransferase [Planctomycetota bacterium]|jgi:3-phosphoshikimate 1-carboxyvinyltransferase